MVDAAVTVGVGPAVVTGVVDAVLCGVPAGEVDVAGVTDGDDAGVVTGVPAQPPSIASPKASTIVRATPKLPMES